MIETKKALKALKMKLNTKVTNAKELMFLFGMVIALGLIIILLFGMVFGAIGSILGAFLGSALFVTRMVYDLLYGMFSFAYHEFWPDIYYKFQLIMRDPNDRFLLGLVVFLIIMFFVFNRLQAKLPSVENKQRDKLRKLRGDD